MAKDNDSNKKPGKVKKKKGGKKKWFLLFFLLVTGLAAGAYYLDFGKTVMTYLPKTGFLSKSGDYIGHSVNYVSELKDSFFSDEDDSSIPGDIPQSIIEIEGEGLKGGAFEDTTEFKSKHSYYVKVEDCINVTCQQEVIKYLKRERLPYTKKQITRKTRYFELISTNVFTRAAAKTKIDLLKLEPEIKGDPYLVKVSNRYKVSLGQFPHKDTGVRVKTELIHLYPRLKMEFELRPKTTFYQVSSFFAGPFDKRKATSIHRKLQENPEYETSEITSSI